MKSSENEVIRNIVIDEDIYIHSVMHLKAFLAGKNHLGSVHSELRITPGITGISIVILKEEFLFIEISLACFNESVISISGH